MHEIRTGGPSLSELGEVRVKLDQATERITSRFKDRSRFPVNPAIYEIDGVPIAGRAGISLLQFAIEGLQAYHASLGRFDYADQFPVLNLQLPESRVTRIQTKPTLPKIEINTGEPLINFYQSLIAKYCLPGNDPNSYGETAYIDADLIQLIHERINIGRLVAEIKAAKDPSVKDMKSDRAMLLTKLQDTAREQALLEKVGLISNSYGLNPSMTGEAFRWIMDQTLDLEVTYLQQI